MKKRTFLLTACLSLCALLLASCGAEGEPETGTLISEQPINVSYVSGEVLLQSKGEESALYVDDNLFAGDEIQTGADGIVILKMEGGKQIHVAENSRLVVSSAETSQEGECTTLNLESGNVISVIAEELGESELYAVETPELIMAIRGTIASVSRDAASGESSVVFLDGAGVVYAAEGPETLTVSVGEALQTAETRLERLALHPDMLHEAEARFLFDDDYRSLLDTADADAIATRLEALLADEDFAAAKAAYQNGPADPDEVIPENIAEEPTEKTPAPPVDTTKNNVTPPAQSSEPEAPEAPQEVEEAPPAVEDGFTLEQAKSAFSAQHPNASITVAKREGNVYYIEGQEDEMIYKMKFSTADGSVMLDKSISTGRQ